MGDNNSDAGGGGSTSNSMMLDGDPDELAKFFPSFLWVVRDFTLRLLDLDGNKINPKEYLE